MSRHRLALTILIAAAILCGVMAGATLAQQPPNPGCGPLPGYLQFLQERFNEFRVLELRTEDGKFVITRSNEGTWTVLKVEGQDAACIFAAGRTSLVDRGI